MGSKALANQILKQLGNANIKLMTGEYGNDQTYRNRDGKMVKGIKYATSGPLDCFLNIRGRERVKREEIIAAFTKAGFKIDGNNIIITETKKKVTYLSFWPEKLQTYTRSANLDTDYKSHYLLPEYSTESK